MRTKSNAFAFGPYTEHVAGPVCHSIRGRRDPPPSPCQPHWRCIGAELRVWGVRTKRAYPWEQWENWEKPCKYSSQRKSTSVFHWGGRRDWREKPPNTEMQRPCWLKSEEGAGGDAAVHWWWRSELGKIPNPGPLHEHQCYWPRGVHHLGCSIQGPVMVFAKQFCLLAPSKGVGRFIHKALLLRRVA